MSQKSLRATIVGAASLLSGAASLLSGAVGLPQTPNRLPVDPARRVAPSQRRVAFTIAAIALAAKMARADGNASPAEFATFQRLFQVDPAEAANARRFYNVAKQSMAGFERYAGQAADLLGQGSPMLENLLDALWLIAAVDGFHPDELTYLDAVAARLGFNAAAAARIKARHTGVAQDDPANDCWAVLGVPPGADAATLRTAYHALVRQYHPDRHFAQGVPSEFIRITESRMATINAAYARAKAAR